MGAVLGQYCINVTDLERSIAFWDGVIGIPVLSHTDLPDGTREAILQAPGGGSRMQLAQHPGAGPVDMGSAMWKLYVITDDCRALHEQVVAAGFEAVAPPFTPEQWPVTMSFVKDPDGYLVELVEYTERLPVGIPDPATAGAAR
jgi:lactoylglutathione lyase